MVHGSSIRIQVSLSHGPIQHLYLFGRGQDVGFQKAIDNSPRKRHHIRFWALSLDHAESKLGTASFWLNTDRPQLDARVHWVGAGTKDTGFSLTKLTFQITHATDSDTNAERDYIIADLKKNRVVGELNSYRAGERLPAERINHYVSDGEVTAASLTAEV
jgi:LssY C-terminus